MDYNEIYVNHDEKIIKLQDYINLKIKPNINTILAIVGSRNFTNYNKFLDGINEGLSSQNITISDIVLIVSGGADGADAMAEKYAKYNNITTKIYEAKWNKYGKSAGQIRNQKIVNLSNFMIAFVANDSVGTYDSINKAKIKKIPIHIVKV